RQELEQGECFEMELKAPGVWDGHRYEYFAGIHSIPAIELQRICDSILKYQTVTKLSLNCALDHAAVAVLSTMLRQARTIKEITIYYRALSSPLSPIFIVLCNHPTLQTLYIRRTISDEDMYDWADSAQQ